MIVFGYYHVGHAKKSGPKDHKRNETKRKEKKKKDKEKDKEREGKKHWEML